MDTAHTSRLREAFFDYGIPLLLMIAAIGAAAAPQFLPAGEAPAPLLSGSSGLAPVTANGLTYVLIAAVFLPLVFRRKHPLAVLATTTLLSAAYAFSGGPSAPTQFAPLLALFTVGTLSDRRTVWASYAAVIVLTLGVTVQPSSDVRWIADALVIATSFAAAAALGDAARSRREYVAAVEERALEAERTREEEARRRVGEERLRIARELHDVTAHSLSIIALQSGAAEKAVKRDPDAAIAALRTIRVTSKESLDELRAMLGVLRNADEDAPLSPAGRLERLPDLVRSVEQAGVRVTLDVSDDFGDVPAYADVSAYRIVQEAITNIVRHAQASSARVVVRREADELSIEVADDGRGATAGAIREGHGIVGMRERATVLGGTFDAGPLEGGGFRVAARLPLTRGA